MPKSFSRYLSFDEPRGGAFAAALEVTRRRPADVAAGVLAAACAAMALVNALALQTPRRPVAEAVSPGPQRSELVAQIQAALANRGYYDGAFDGIMGSRTASGIRAFQQAERMEQTGEASDQLLTAILMAPFRKPDAPAAAPAPAQPASRPPAAAAPAPAVTGSTAISAAKLMAVQKALSKLGYGPVAIDGKMGGATRSAIQAFERDRNMPETGEPSTPVLRALQAMSGTPLL